MRASPAEQGASGRRALSNPGPAARWIAPFTPPLPASGLFAALTIASTTIAVISPRATSIRVIGLLEPCQNPPT